jgi:LmbE family N-acetylglucosaminyl deacetylase
MWNWDVRTILKEISLGKTVGIIDLTEGIRDLRIAEIRDQEANAAAKILGFLLENLEMRDGFVNDEKHQLEIIKNNQEVPTGCCVMQLTIVILITKRERLVSNACFLSD